MRQASFWLAVAGVSIVAQPLFRLVADSKVGAAVPGVRDLYHYSSAKNG